MVVAVVLRPGAHAKGATELGGPRTGEDLPWVSGWLISTLRGIRGAGFPVTAWYHSPLACGGGRPPCLTLASPGPPLRRAPTKSLITYHQLHSCLPPRQRRGLTGPPAHNPAGGSPCCGEPPIKVMAVARLNAQDPKCPNSEHTATTRPTPMRGTLARGGAPLPVVLISIRFLRSPRLVSVRGLLRPTSTTHSFRV